MASPDRPAWEPVMYMQFPVPVTIDDDEVCLVVHRDIRGQAHTDTRTCWCCPAVFSQDELQTLTAAQLNSVVRHGVQ